MNGINCYLSTYSDMTHSLIGCLGRPSILKNYIPSLSISDRFKLESTLDWSIINPENPISKLGMTEFICQPFAFPRVTVSAIISLARPSHMILHE